MRRWISVLSAHQRLALRETVGEQFDMMIEQGMLRLKRGDEIGRHERGALMQHLEKGMLTVGSRRAIALARWHRERAGRPNPPICHYFPSQAAANRRAGGAARMYKARLNGFARRKNSGTKCRAAL